VLFHRAGPPLHNIPEILGAAPQMLFQTLDRFTFGETGIRVPLDSLQAYSTECVPCVGTERVPFVRTECVPCILVGLGVAHVLVLNVYHLLGLSGCHIY
jgi:hypothetical protein